MGRTKGRQNWEHLSTALTKEYPHVRKDEQLNLWRGILLLVNLAEQLTGQESRPVLYIYL
jgi:hypothetical protein